MLHLVRVAHRILVFLFLLGISICQLQLLMVEGSTET